MIIFVVLSLIHAHVNKHTKDNFTTVFVCTVIRTAEIHYYTCFRINNWYLLLWECFSRLNYEFWMEMMYANTSLICPSVSTRKPMNNPYRSAAEAGGKSPVHTETFWIYECCFYTTSVWSGLTRAGQVWHAKQTSGQKRPALSDRHEGENIYVPSEPNGRKTTHKHRCECHKNVLKECGKI